MSEIPIESKNLIEEFLASQRAEELRRQQEKQDRFSKRDNRDPFSPKSSKDLQRYATQNGFDVVGGGGRHGVQIIAPDGSRCPLPDHGGRDLARGTQRSIVGFIQSYAR